MFKNNSFQVFLCVVALLSFFVTFSNSAQDLMSYQDSGLDPVKLYDSAIGGEEVDLFRGALHIEQTDVTLPGRHGLDLNVTRWYDSKILDATISVGGVCGVLSYTTENGECLGVGWRMHMGRFYQQFPTIPQYPPATPNTTPSSADYLELPGGKRISFYRTTNTELFPSVFTASLARTGPGYWLAIYPSTYCESGCSPLVIYSPEGVKYTFDQAWTRSVGTNLVEWNVTSIQKGDSTITINYTKMPDHNYTYYISSIVDSYGRTVSFTYYNDGNATKVNPLINIKYPVADNSTPATMLYYYHSTGNDYPHQVTVTAPESRWVTPTFGNQQSPTMRTRTDATSYYALGCVQPPTGSTYRTYYQYYFDNGAGGANAGNLIAGIKYPNGSYTGYEYAFQTRGDWYLGAVGCYLVLSRRAIQGDLIAGTTSPTSSIRTWEYGYSISGSGDTSTWKASIDTPVGSREDYYFNPFVPLTGVTCSSGDCSSNDNYQRWRVGLLLKKEIYTSDSETDKLLEESNTYDKIPFDDTYFPWICNSGSFKEKGFSPILTSKTTTLTVPNGTLASTITYSGPDQYGNPGTIEEKDWGNSTVRTKQLLYAWLPNNSTLHQNWFIHLPSYITTKSGTTTIANSYSAYSTTSPHIGFPTKQREWVNNDGNNSNYWQGENLTYECDTSSAKEDEIIHDVGYSTNTSTWTLTAIRTITDTVKKGTPLSRIVDDTGSNSLTVFNRTLDTNCIAPLEETIDGTTDYSYDQYGRLSQVTAPTFSNNSGSVTPDSTTVTYSPTQITMSTGTAGASQTYLFDGFGELARKTQKAGTSTIYDDTAKDALGRVTTKYMSTYGPSEEGYTEYAYDALGRILTTTLKQHTGTTESTATYSYSKDGNLLKVTITSPKDATSGTITSYEWYDSQGRLRQQKDANNITRTFTYDALNRLTTIADGAQTRSYTYNSRGDMLTQTTPENGLLTMKYDRLGNLTSRKFADNTTLSYTVDFAGRVTEVTFPDNSKVVNYYDAYPSGYSCASASSFAAKHLVYQRQYDSGNNIIQSTCSAYDSHGRIFAKRYVADATNYDVKYDYDKDGFLSKLYYPSGKTVTAVLMNNMGWPTSLKNESNVIFATNLSYSSQGKILNSASATNATVLANVEDDFGRLTSNSLKYGSNILYSDAVAYYPSGNLSAQDFQYKDTAGNLTHYWKYTYDLLHRLTNAKAKTSNNSVVGEVAYSYDSFGNITTRSFPGSPNFPNALPLNYSASYSDNRKNGVSYVYDGRGNITNDSGIGYTYNNLNQIVSASGCQNVYDSQGRRIKEICTAGSFTQSTYYIYDDAGNLLSECVKFPDGTPTVRRENIYLSGQLVSQWTADNYCITQSVNPSGTGTITRTPDRDCFDWGETCTLTATPATGYKFRDWTVNGITISGTILNLCMDEKKTVIANFYQNCITKTIQPALSGSITSNPPNSNWCFEPDTNVQLTAQPADGCQFSSWQVGTTTYTQNPLVLYMDGNKTVIAKFQYCVSQSVTPSVTAGSISLSPTGPCYDDGSNIGAQATANSGYVFSYWLLNGENVGSSTSLDFTIHGPTQLQAVFTDLYACSPPPQPLDLTAENAHKDELTGHYKILLEWHHINCTTPLQYQVIYRIPSASSWEYSNPISSGQYQQNGEQFSYMWNPPQGCQDYYIMVRGYNGVQYGEESDAVLQKSTAVSPPIPGYFFVWCRGANPDPLEPDEDILYWRVPEEYRCAITGFNIRLSQYGPVYQTVVDDGIGGLDGIYYTITLPCQNPGNEVYFLSVLIGTAEGTAIQASSTPVPMTIPMPSNPPTFHIVTTLTQPNISIADISGDALFDLVLQSAYFKADPNGTFTDSSTDLNTTAGNGDLIRVADMDGNSTLDRIIAHKKSMWIEINDGEGHFILGPQVDLAKNVDDVIIAQLPAYWGTSVLVMNDKDLAFYSYRDNQWIEQRHISLPRKGTAIKAGDLDGDGLSDIAVGTTNGIILYLYSVDDQEWINEDIPSAGNVSAIDLADANGDGFIDIGVGPQGEGKPFILLFTPFPYPPMPIIPVPHIWIPKYSDETINIPGIRQITFVDLDGRGLPGLLVVSEGEGRSTYLTNNGAGKLYPTNFVLDAKVLGVGIGDLDGNGLLDVVAVKNKIIDIYESQYVEPSSERTEDEEQDNPPGQVRNVAAEVSNGRIILQWTGAEDDHTPSPALTYEVAVGRSTGVWDILPGEIGPGQISSRKGNVLNATRVNLPLPEGVTEVHYGIQAIDSGFRKGQWVFGTVTVPAEKKDEEGQKETTSQTAEDVTPVERIEDPCEEGAMHIARLLEKQGYVTTTWAGGIVSYLPGEPRNIENTPTLPVNGKYLYPAFDATGTVRMWADGSGNIIARNAPGPYGENLGYFPGPRTSMLGYAGYLGDKGGSGLWHTPNRSLTNQGRFLSVDPSGTLNLHDPRTFNQYAYVAGNPIMYVDPLGLAAWNIFNQWDDKSIDEYRNFVSKNASSYKGDYTCEDFALSLLIDYSSRKSLPVKIHTGYGIYDAASDQYSTVSEFKHDVLVHTGARDLQNTQNTLAKPLREVEPGDILLKTKAGVATHTQVVVSVEDSVIQINQGNFNWISVFPKVGSPNPKSPLYLGTEVQSGVFYLDMGHYYRGNSQTFQSINDMHLESRSWNFMGWNK